MKVECVSGDYNVKLQQRINEAIEKIEKDGNVVVDIKQSSSSIGNSIITTATIIYCTQSEIRNVKLNKILEN